MRQGDPGGLLARLATAAWGACGGVLAATAAVGYLVATGDRTDYPHPALLYSDYLKPYRMVAWQEGYERAWFVLVCALGAAGAWVARFVRPSPWLAAAAALAFVPAAGAVCRGVFVGKFVTGRFLTAGVILLVPALVRLVRRPGTLAPSPAPDEPAPPGRPRVTLLLALALVVTTVGVLAPADLAEAAAECTVETHVASYLVGPALYYRSPDAVPGLDFESHYGIGHAYSFSLVMGRNGLQDVLERFVLFVLVVTVLYFLSAFVVLADWLGSPWAAFAVALVLVAAAVEGLAYPMPSCWPVRHPFAFAFLFALVRGCDPGAQGRAWCLAAGGLAGVSLWWQTDTGLYALVAGAGLLGANWVFAGGRFTRPALFAATGLGTFLALCLALFGPRVLSITFAERLLEPLLLYGSGFGNALINWRGPWAHWYALAGPVVAVASVGVLMGYRRGEPVPRAALYAAAASLLGLAMLTKWVNRSIDIVWALNGGLVLAVAGAWVWAGWRAVAARLASDTDPRLGVARRGVVGIMLVVFVVAGIRADVRGSQPHPLLGQTSPLARIANRLDTYPNLVNALRRGNEWYPYPPRPVPFDEEAVAFVRDRTAPGEPVALVSRHEWSFLAAAGRAPRLYWLQLYLIHTPVLLDRTAADLVAADRVFVDRDAILSLRLTNPGVHGRVAPLLEANFQPAEESPRWIVYRRKPSPGAGR